MHPPFFAAAPQKKAIPHTSLPPPNFLPLFDAPMVFCYTEQMTITKKITKAAKNTKTAKTEKSGKNTTSVKTSKAAKTPAGKKPSRSGKSKSRRLPFKKNQQVVYPLQGVGKILSIEERIFKDKKTPYFIIYLEVSDMTVMVPVDKAVGLGIRAIVSKKEAENALTFIAEEGEAIPTDWKLRYQMNLDLLKRGSVVDIAKVVRTLYHRSKIKELPILERKLFDNALKLLVDEISFAINQKKDEVEQLIFTKLEADLPEKLKTPVATVRDDDENYEGFDEEQENLEDEEEDGSDY
jgi:CarD family transcriptional regulator